MKSSSVIVNRLEERSDHDYGRRLRLTSEPARAMFLPSARSRQETEKLMDSPTTRRSIFRKPRIARLAEMLNVDDERSEGENT